MYGILTYLVLIGLCFTQNRNDLTRSSLFGFKLKQKDIIYYSFNQLPSTDSLKQVDFHFSIQKNIFVYEKKSEDFESYLEILLHLENNGTSKTGIWNETIRAESFSETESNKHFEIVKRVQIKPGKYDVNLKVTDRSSQKFRLFKSKVEIKKDSETPFISDIKFYKSDHFLVNQSALDIRDSIDITFNYRTNSDYNIAIKVIDLEQDIEFYQFKSSIKNSFGKIRNKSNQIDMRRLGEGKYKIVYNFSNKKKDIIREKEFEVIYWDKPETLYSTELAIRPFQVLLTDLERSTFQQKNTSEQIQYFNRYWEDRNQNKNYKFNSLKNEFFKRADYAVHNYSTKLRAGWDTDRGVTYILFGKPEKVEKKFADQGEFQIWIYNNFKKIFFKDNFAIDYSEIDSAEVKYD